MALFFLLTIYLLPVMVLFLRKDHVQVFMVISVKSRTDNFSFPALQLTLARKGPPDYGHEAGLL
jgi:hypothetical protein